MPDWLRRHLASHLCGSDNVYTIHFGVITSFSVFDLAVKWNQKELSSERLRRDYVRSQAPINWRNKPDPRTRWSTVTPEALCQRSVEQATWSYFLNYTTLLHTCQVPSLPRLAGRKASAGTRGNPRTPSEIRVWGSQVPERLSTFRRSNGLTRGFFVSIVIICPGTGE